MPCVWLWAAVLVLNIEHNVGLSVDYRFNIRQLADKALAEPRNAVVWRQLGDTLHDAMRFDNKVAPTNYAVWCYARALKARSGEGMAALGMASLATSGHWWQYRQIWPRIVSSRALGTKKPRFASNKSNAVKSNNRDDPVVC